MVSCLVRKFQHLAAPLTTNGVLSCLCARTETLLLGSVSSHGDIRRTIESNGTMLLGRIETPEGINSMDWERQKMQYHSHRPSLTPKDVKSTTCAVTLHSDQPNMHRGCTLRTMNNRALDKRTLPARYARYTALSTSLF
jgi:hypothetical protein